MTTVLLHEGSAAPKLEPPPRPQVRAVRGGNHGLNRVRHVMRTAVIVLILAVFGGLAISSLMSGATLMELNAQVDEVSAQLAEALEAGRYGQYIWITRDCGTHLVPVGIAAADPDQSAELLAAIRRTWPDGQRHEYCITLGRCGTHSFQPLRASKEARA